MPMLCCKSIWPVCKMSTAVVVVVKYHRQTALLMLFYLSISITITSDDSALHCQVGGGLCSTWASTFLAIPAKSAHLLLFCYLLLLVLFTKPLEKRKVVHLSPVSYFFLQITMNWSRMQRTLSLNHRQNGDNSSLCLTKNWFPAIVHCDFKMAFQWRCHVTVAKCNWM